MKVKVSSKKLVEQAMEKIESIDIAELKKQQSNPSHKIIDIRDIRELNQFGKIPNAIHIPRGMLEFWIDCDSPYYKPEIFDNCESITLYCASNWRSALATLSLQEMGLESVNHLTGGFNAWQSANEEIEHLNP